MAALEHFGDSVFVVVQYERGNLADLDVIVDLETRSYPEDEAASKERIRYRLENANEYFYCCWMQPNGPSSKRELIGFVNGTLAHGETLRHEAMATHEKTGSSLCVHSVVVDKRYRRRAHATAMLKFFVNEIREKQANVRTILLICKAPLIPFYIHCGFDYAGISRVDYGADKWFEMRLRLRQSQ